MHISTEAIVCARARAWRAWRRRAAADAGGRAARGLCPRRAVAAAAAGAARRQRRRRPSIARAPTSSLPALTVELVHSRAPLHGEPLRRRRDRLGDRARRRRACPRRSPIRASTPRSKACWPRSRRRRRRAAGRRRWSATNCCCSANSASASISRPASATGARDDLALRQPEERRGGERGGGRALCRRGCCALPPFLRDGGEAGWDDIFDGLRAHRPFPRPRPADRAARGRAGGARAAGRAVAAACAGLMRRRGVRGHGLLARDSRRRQDMLVALLPGDGIGPEVIEQAVRVLRAVCGDALTFEEAPVGGAAYKAAGPSAAAGDARSRAARRCDPVRRGRRSRLRRARAAACGPSRRSSGCARSWRCSPTCARRKLFPELADASALRPEVARAIDLVIVRELNGDVYFGEKGHAHHRRRAGAQGYDVMSYDEDEVARIARVGFETARARQGQALLGRQGQCAGDLAAVARRGDRGGGRLSRCRARATCMSTMPRCSWCAIPASST